MATERARPTEPDVVGRTIRERVVRRATHHDVEDVSKTVSDWSVAQIVTQEYHGRFILELLQNARDAFLEASPGRTDGKVRITLTSEPALVVANQGAPMPTDVLLLSIGRYGQGTKTAGTSIGHKGIGFKAVLELTLTPEIYSGRRGGGYDLAVRFDPDEAQALVRRHTPDWEDLVRQLPGGEESDLSRHVPVLQFPIWVDDPRERLRGTDESPGVRFDTVVRLPHDDRFAAELGLTSDSFIARVRQAMTKVSDQIVLLLGAFSEVRITDELAGTEEVIARVVEESRLLPDGSRRTTVTINRNGGSSSRWYLYERTLAGFQGLEGDVAVAVRTTQIDGRDTLAPPAVRQGDSGGQFHLFFPTDISTQLPFLLHGYFQVNAGRTRFAGGEATRNERVLDGIRALGVAALRDLLSLHRAGTVDVRPLASLFASVDADPEDDLAAAFRSAFLEDVDEIAWVPCQSEVDGPRFAMPVELLIETDPQVLADLPVAVPVAHLRRRTGLSYPDPSVGAGRAFLAERAIRKRGSSGITGPVLRDVLRRATDLPWGSEAGEPDRGFSALARVLTRLRGVRGDVVGVLADADVDYAFIPVLDASPPFRRLRGPVMSRGVDRAQPWILARTTASMDPALAPPREVGVDFLPDGLLDEAGVNSLSFLGVREYRTDTVVDALLPERLPFSAAGEVARFACRLLVRDTQSIYSVPRTIEMLDEFEPGRWFWSRQGLRTPDEREELRRAGNLARIKVLARDGSLQSADQVCFGADWAGWAERRGSQRDAAGWESRADAYRWLEELAPEPSQLVAGPEELTAWLGFGQTVASEDGIDPTSMVHAFLVRVGVWEVPPVDSVNDLAMNRSAEEADPWSGDPLRASHRRRLAGSFIDYDHKRVLVGEDFRLRWAPAPSRAMATALAWGIPLYRRCDKTYLYCPACKTHRNERRDNLADTGRPSMLRHQLEHQPWVPVLLGDSPDVRPVPAIDAWRDSENTPQSSVGQSAVRFLPRLPPWFPRELQDFLSITDLDSAGPVRIRRLLAFLYERLDEMVGPDPRHGSERGRAYLSLHRRLYQRLGHFGTERMRPATDKTGVLVTRGQALGFASIADARHDGGDFSVYRKHFPGLPFVVLKADQSALAKDFGIAPFSVTVTRADSDDGRDMTDEVREFVHDRMHLYFTALCYHAIGGTTLDVGSRRFRERAELFRSLTLHQVADMRLTLTTSGSPETVVIGEGSSNDLFVDRSGTAPTVYFDFQGATWPDRLRRSLGPHLASLLGNDAYASDFRLLLEAPTEADAIAILGDVGIDADQIAEVASALESGDAIVRDEQERWWAGLLPLLGVSVDVRPRDADWFERLKGALEVAGLLEPPRPGRRLLDIRPEEDPRTDISDDGVLAALERDAVDLQELHLRLGPDDRGLDVRAAERRLHRWRSLHRHLVVAVLGIRGVADARARPDAWRVPPGLEWRVAVGPEIYLEPVLDDLRAADLTDVDADRLEGPDAAIYLASLVGLTPDALMEAWHEAATPADGARLARDQAASWRSLLLPILVAARTNQRIGCGGWELRAEQEAVQQGLLGATTPADLAARFGELLATTPALAQALQDLLVAGASLSLPDRQQLVGLATQHGVDAAHMERVQRVLEAGARVIVDRTRRDIAFLRSAKVLPKAVETDSPPSRPKPGPPPGGRKRVHGVKHVDVNTGRIGRVAEAWARASVIDSLLRLERDLRTRTVDAMCSVLESRFEGDPVALVLDAGQAYKAAEDDDQAIEALVRMVDVSAISDGFGFDLLGWLPQADTDPPDAGVTFLEVKSAGSRSFEVSAHEWEVAGLPAVADRYAFLVVLRDQPGQPAQMELLHDPHHLVESGALTMVASNWKFTYTLRP